MKAVSFPSKRNTEVQILSLITLILLLISILGLFYKIYAYHEIRESVSTIESLYTGIAISNFMRFFLLIFMGSLLYLSLKDNLKIKIIAYFALISGFFTVLFIFSDWTALHDFLHGDTVLDWSFLRLGLITNFIFYSIGLIAILKIRCELSSLTIRKSVINETFFEVIQYIGIISSLIGLGFILFICLTLFHNNHVISRYDIVIMNLFSIVILFPYISIVFYWLTKLIIEENPQPYDEKQKHDLAMAGLVTWILSIPIVVIFSLFNHGRMGEIFRMVYMPFYLFATLLIFSISAMRNFRKS